MAWAQGRFAHRAAPASAMLPRMANLLGTRSLGMLLLGIYLVLVGIMGLVATLAIPPIVLAVLALVAGILILIGR